MNECLSNSVPFVGALERIRIAQLNRRVTIGCSAAIGKINNALKEARLRFVAPDERVSSHSPETHLHEAQVEYSVPRHNKIKTSS